VTAPAVTSPVAIPASHRDLFTRPVCGVLTSIGPDGQPHSTLVWVGIDEDGCAVVSSALDRRQVRNLLENPRTSLLVVDPENIGRFVQVRGDAGIETAGAEALADELARRYTRHERFYGGVYPADARQRETRVIVRIHPRRVTLDAIHA
jgi:PPOX class probable F420-dependent enzyme